MSASPQQQFDAIKTALDTALQAPVAGAMIPADRKAYDYDNVPSDRPEAYVALGVSRRYIDGFRFGGPHGVRAGRLTTGYIARYADDARALQAIVRASLEDVALTAANGSLVGPFRFETEQPIGEDDGWMYGLDSWTFANPA